MLISMYPSPAFGKDSLRLFSSPDIELHGPNHIFRVKDGIQVFLSQDALLQHEVIDTASGLQGFLGDVRGVVVTDVGIQSRDDTDAVAHFRLTMFGICR